MTIMTTLSVREVLADKQSLCPLYSPSNVVDYTGINKAVKEEKYAL